VVRKERGGYIIQKPFLASGQGFFRLRKIRVFSNLFNYLIDASILRRHEKITILHSAFVKLHFCFNATSIAAPFYCHFQMRKRGDFCFSCRQHNGHGRFCLKLFSDTLRISPLGIKVQFSAGIPAVKQFWLKMVRNRIYQG